MSSELEGYQYWWAIALTLVMVELAKPHGKLIWIAIVAMISGILMRILPDMAWISFVNFVVLAPVAVWWADRTQKRKAELLEDMGRQYLGQVFELKEPIIDGTGQLIHSDNTWVLKGQDSAVGERMVVIEVNGNELTVERENQV